MTRTTKMTEMNEIIEERHHLCKYFYKFLKKIMTRTTKMTEMNEIIEERHHLCKYFYKFLKKIPRKN